MESFHERKQKRTEIFNKYIKGWRLRECSACNGSGRYDHNGSPDCGSCDGTGKERYDHAKCEKESLEIIIEFKGTHLNLDFWLEFINTPHGREYMKFTEEGQFIHKHALEKAQRLGLKFEQPNWKFKLI